MPRKKIPMEENVQYTKGDNVFEDLGFSPDESIRLRLKQDLWLRIMEVVKANNYTQHQVSKILDIPQPRVSLVMRGLISNMTVDSLLEFAYKLDRSLVVEVKTKAG